MPAPIDLPVPLPGYRVYELLYEGALHWLARAEDSLARPVLIKLSRQESGAAAITRLNNDVQWSRALRCGHVSRTTRTETLPYGWLLQEKDAAAGRALVLHAHDKPDLAADLRALCSVASALADLHAQGVAHGAVREDDLLYDPLSDHATFIDLGAARSIEAALPGKVAPAIREDLRALGALVELALTGAGAGTGPLLRLAEKLRANTPGAYRTAHGVRADLERCLDEWTRTGAIGRFALGRFDFCNELPFSDQLYGRKPELARLAEALPAAHGGGAALVVLDGASGCGKTALLRACRDLASEQGASFALGKCEPNTRRTPYAPLVEALEALVEPLCAPGDARGAQLRDRLEETADPSSWASLAEELPLLERVLGPQPKPPALPANETRHRLMDAWVGLLRALCETSPLVLCLDDLHWSDEATVQVLERLVGHGRLASGLIVLTYRTEELDETHVAWRLLREPPAGGLPRTTLSLSGLNQPEITRWLSDLLGADIARAAPLAELIWRRSGGNPFFARELLRGAVGKQLLFDPEHYCWRWSIEQLRDAACPDAVAELLAARVQRLPTHVRRDLQLAACLGQRFDRRLLTQLSPGRSEESAAANLDECVALGLIAPVQAGAVAEETQRYTFTHDRIQQSTYASLEPSHAARTHAAIAEHLLAQRAAGVDVSPAVLLHHMEHGHSQLRDADAAARLRGLYLDAGLAAKRAGAFATAAELFSRGAALPENPGGAPDEAFGLALERAESRFAAGHEAEASADFDLLLRDTADPERYARVCLRYLRCKLHFGSFAQAIEIGLRGLKRLGIVIVEAPGAFRLALPLLRTLLIHRALEADLNDSSPRKPPRRIRLALHLLANLWGPAFWTDQRLTGLIVLQMLRLSHEHGYTASSTIAYASYGVLLALAFKQVEAGQRLSRQALALAERDGNPVYLWRVRFMHTGFFGHIELPLRAELAQMRRCLRGSLDCGDYTYAAASGNVVCYLLLLLDYPLTSIHQELQAVRERLALAHDARSITTLEIIERFARILTERESYAQPRFTRAFLDDTSPDFANERGVFFLFELALLYTLGKLEQAEALAPRMLGNPMHTGYYAAYHAVFTALVAAGLAWRDPPRRRKRRIDVVRAQLAFVTRHAQREPTNYADKVTLLRAVLADLSDERADLQALFDEALQSARDQGFMHLAALGAELAEGCFARRQQPALAARYALQARLAYGQWGCQVKLAALASEPAQAVLPATSSERPPAPALERLQTISHELARQLDADHVIDQLLATLLRETGAQRAALVVARGDGHVVYRASDEDDDSTRTCAAVPLEETTELPKLIVDRVLRSGRPQVLDDAYRDPAYGNDPYVMRTRPRSLLCLPLSAHQRQYGAVLLEDAHSAAFGKERIALVDVLTQQAATALQSATHQEQQLERLRANIGPHFLFNALNAIADLMTSDAGSAEQALVDLSRLYRWLLTHAEQQAVPLDEELRFVESYLRLEKLRLEDRLSYTVDASREALAVPVPAWIVQPLVENAVKHGVACRRGAGSVRVQATLNGAELCVLVENETGDTAEPRARSAGTGFGLRNLKQRLSAHFGDRYSLTLAPRAGGMAVALRVPLA